MCADRCCVFQSTWAERVSVKNGSSSTCFANCDIRLVIFICWDSSRQFKLGFIIWGDYIDRPKVHMLLVFSSWAGWAESIERYFHTCSSFKFSGRCMLTATLGTIVGTTSCSFHEAIFRSSSHRQKTYQPKVLLQTAKKLRLGASSCRA